jgi:hypothetical protein
MGRGPDTPRPINRGADRGFGPLRQGMTAGMNTPTSFFEEILARVENLEVAGVPAKRTTFFVKGLKHLPISYRVR